MLLTRLIVAINVSPIHCLVVGVGYCILSCLKRLLGEDRYVVWLGTAYRKPQVVLHRAVRCLRRCLLHNGIITRFKR